MTPEWDILLSLNTRKDSKTNGFMPKGQRNQTGEAFSGQIWSK